MPRALGPGRHQLSVLQELVEWVLEEVAQRPRAVGAQGGPLILEVGCGSGAISLSLLSQLPQVSPLCTPPPCPGYSLSLSYPSLLEALDGK